MFDNTTGYQGYYMFLLRYEPVGLMQFLSVESFHGGNFMILFLKFEITLNHAEGDFSNGEW